MTHKAGMPWVAISFSNFVLLVIVKSTAKGKEKPSSHPTLLDWGTVIRKGYQEAPECLPIQPCDPYTQMEED